MVKKREAIRKKKSKPYFIDPIVRTDSQKKNRFSVNKTKDDTIFPIDAKTPHLLGARNKLFGMERRMEGILRESRLLFDGAFLHRLWNFSIPFLKLFRQKNFNHIRMMRSAPILVLLSL